MTYIYATIPGIQDYVFATGTILDAVGRSAVVSDLGDPGREPLRTALQASGASLVASRAGDLAVFAPDRERAQAWVAAFTRGVHDLAPSLRPVVVVSEEHLDNPAAELYRARGSGVAAEGFVPYGIVPAANVDAAADAVARIGSGSTEPSTREKERARERGREWHASRPVPQPRGLGSDWSAELPLKIDDIGVELGSESKVAVLVLDANDMGARFATLDEETSGRASESFREVMAELSEHLVATVASSMMLREDREIVVAGRPANLEVHPVTHRSVVSLPIRPLVSGGDDLVVVTESRLAWHLAESACAFLDAAPEGTARWRLAHLESQGTRPFGAPDGLLTVTLGIGIAVVPAGYSLARAHEVAARIAKGAKSRRRAARAGMPDRDAHVIEWALHVEGESGLTEETAPLPTARPYVRGRPGADLLQPHGAGSWRALLEELDPGTVNGVRSDQSSHGKPWAGRRTVLKGDVLAAVTADPRSALNAVRALQIGDSAGLPDVTRPELPRLVDLSAITEAQLGGVLDVIELIDEHLTVVALEGGVS